MREGVREQMLAVRSCRQHGHDWTTWFKGADRGYELRRCKRCETLEANKIKIAAEPPTETRQ